MNNLYIVSVIIPTYHDWDRLKLCLEALEHQSYPANRFEVLVVNNDPEDQPPYVVAGGNVRLLEEAKPGSYAARNAAIQVAKGEILAFTDSDCIPAKTWLDEGLKLILGGADRIAGKIDVFHSSIKPTWAEIYEIHFSLPQSTYAEIGFGATANMITRCICFDKVGLFNAELLSGGDFEWGMRVQGVGLPILYAPSVIVEHPARTRLAELLKKNLRVSSGHYVMNEQSWLSTLRTFIRSIAPPFKFICTRQNIRFCSGLGLKLFLVAWLMRFSTGCFVVLLKIKILRPTRS